MDDFMELGIDLRCMLIGNVGNGENVQFWCDRWVSSVPLMDLFPSLFALVRSKKSTVRECCTLLNGTSSWRWRWKRELINEQELVELEQLQHALSAINLTSTCDTWRWGDGEEIGFCTKQVKQLLRSKMDEVQVCNFPWNGWVPPKVNIHNWRANLNRLPTCDSLVRMNIPLQSVRCPLCDKEDEMVDHIFTACEVALQVWSKVSSWCRIKPVFAFTFGDLMEIPYTLRGDFEYKKAVHAVFMATVWSLWKHRNEVIHEQIKPSWNRVLSESLAVSSLWLKARIKKGVPSFLMDIPCGVG